MNTLESSLCQVCRSSLGIVIVTILPCLLEVQAGTIEFSLAGMYPAGASAQAIAVSDLNGDGKEDFVVVKGNYYYDDGGIRIFTGQGDGTFDEGEDYGLGGATSVAARDIDNDTWPDLIVTAHDYADNVKVLMGRGDATFVSPLSLSAGSLPMTVAVDYFDGDDKLDVAAVNEGSWDVSILLGHGDGTFDPARTSSTPQPGHHLAVADFNNDGETDLATANQYGREVCIMLGIGDGTFEAGQEYIVGIDPIAVATGDFNGDGNEDVVAAVSYNDYVSVMLGNGDGTFGPVQRYLVGRGGDVWPWFVVVDDFNGDGKADIASADYCSCTVSVLLGNGDGTFAAAKLFDIGGCPSCLATGDFDGDGRRDLAVGTFWGSQVAILLNTTEISHDQTIEFGPLENRAYGDRPFRLTATASSGLPVTLRVASGPAVISNDLVTITGTGMVTVVASQEGDATYNPAPDVERSFVVFDRTPPLIIHLSAAPNVLWPPNQKMVRVTVNAVVSDDCDTAPTYRIAAVTSTERVRGLGHGDIGPDWQIVEDHAVCLRAERYGKGTGRMYTLTLLAVDASGNESTATVCVAVPHDLKTTRGAKGK